MNKHAHTALLESIEKWRQIEVGEMADMGVSNCSLCMEFWTIYSCNGCPVSAHTGYKFCIATLYEEWGEVQASTNLLGEIPVADTPELVHLARAERKFLESLLP